MMSSVGSGFGQRGAWADNGRDHFWWPLELSAREREAVQETAERLERYAPGHDRGAAVAASDLLTRKMQRHVVGIVDRDTLPDHCHLLAGWGNARLGSGTLLDGYARYVHRDERGGPYLLQCAAEGDFHPWQSFAYALMAGVAPETAIRGAGCTFLDLAIGSRKLDTEDGAELGHLLYSVAELGFHPTTPFMLGDEVVELSELVELAIEAHFHGHFKVCRKAHLTEGLCAIAACEPELSHHRSAAQGFLEGQLDQLVVLATVMAGVRAAREQGSSIAPDSVVSDLRNSLVIESFAENHYYLAGHLIELASLAHGFGYEVKPLHWAAARFVVDELNGILVDTAPKVWFPGCFLHFGHYRRAITLLEEIADGAPLGRAARARFTADFRDAAQSGDFEPPAQTPDDGVFIVGRITPRMRPELSSVVTAYRARAPSGLEPRGDGGHFRRVLVDGWPRWLHFELLDYGAGKLSDPRGSGIGVELHVENPNEHALGSAVSRVAGELGSALGERVELDPSWGSGRLRVWFEDGAAPAERIASALETLIGVARPILSREVQQRFPGSVGS